MIRPYEPRDKKRVLAILVDAFEEDPYFCRTTPLAVGMGHREAIERMLTADIDYEYSVHGRIDVACDNAAEDAPALGVALWDTPDATPGRVDQVSTAGERARIFGRNSETVMRRSRIEDSFQPRFPHWYLFVLAVGPAAQGRGVGTALLNHGLKRAGDEAIYLEATTPKSARLYERLGFVPLGRLPLFGSAGPNELAMWKAPRLKAPRDGERTPTEPSAD